MSIYRDESILKLIVGDSYRVEASAQLNLFVQVEQNLRRVISQAVKYQMHFRKKQLGTLEVELAIKDQNMIKTNVIGFQYMDSINMNKRQEEYYLNDTNMDLKDFISNQINTVKIPIGNPQLTFFNVMRDNQIVNSTETQNILQFKDIIQIEKKQGEESKKSFSIVKDNITSVLSIHQQEIINQFHKCFEQEVTSLYINYSDSFLRILQELSQFKDVAQILPFIIQYLYSNQDKEFLFNFKRRKVIVDCIYALCINQQINLEYHLHQILRILINFMRSKIEEWRGNSVLELQNRTSKCLNHLLENFSFKYHSLTYNIDKIFLNKLVVVNQKLLNQSNINNIQDNGEFDLTYKRLFKIYSLNQYFCEKSICNMHLNIVNLLSNIVENCHYKQKEINDQSELELIYAIELQFENLLLKIVNGLPYLMPSGQEDAQIILMNGVEILRSLGRQESLIMLSRMPDNYLL